MTGNAVPYLSNSVFATKGVYSVSKAFVANGLGIIHSERYIRKDISKECCGQRRLGPNGQAFKDIVALYAQLPYIVPGPLEEEGQTLIHPYYDHTL